MTCTIQQAGSAFLSTRLASAAPKVTAGLKWPPEMVPNAYTPVGTVSPKAMATQKIDAYRTVVREELGGKYCTAAARKGGTG
jgi:hypothetical protein